MSIFYIYFKATILADWVEYQRGRQYGTWVTDLCRFGMLPFQIITNHPLHIC